MSADGLTTYEKVDILFKKHMNFVSTGAELSFAEEIFVSNTTNIFSDFIMSERPSTTAPFDESSPTYIETSGNVIDLFNNVGFNVDGSWYGDKVDTTYTSVTSFEYDSSNPSVIRFNKIKLNHIPFTASYTCVDNDGNNMLRNMIPFNYATSGYSIKLYYRKNDNSIIPINWLDSVQIQRLPRNTNDTNLEWGAPLFDTANGLVVFYDISYVNSATLNDVFSGQDFYISCTKYVGAMGISGGTGGTVTVSGGSFTNDHLDFNDTTIDLVALDTTLSGEIVSVVGGGTANNDHLDFEDTTIDLVALDTTLSGEIVSVVGGGSATNDHLDFDTVPGITSLVALDTTLSGEIVSVVGGGTANNDHLDFEDATITLTALDTTLSGEIVSVVGGGTANNDHLDFDTVSGIPDLVALDTTTISTTHVGGDMTISKKLGIGNSTTTPEFSLDVHDSTDLSGINGYYLDGSNANLKAASNMTSSITIRAQNDILSGGKIIAESDHRIKKDIVDLSEIESLDLVRNLRPKKYHYIDSTQKTRELVYGYIAQEVKEVLPSAVQHIRGAIPSIFELAQASRSKNNNKGTMLTFRHYNTQNLDPSCEVLKLVDAGQKDHLVHIAKIVDTRHLEIEEHVEEGPIFVYGEEVNDFHVLSKDYINVVAVSALQQMDAHVTQLQEENQALRGELHEIKSILQNNGMI